MLLEPSSGTATCASSASRRDRTTSFSSSALRGATLIEPLRGHRGVQAAHTTVRDGRYVFTPVTAARGRWKPLLLSTCHSRSSRKGHERPSLGVFLRDQVTNWKTARRRLRIYGRAPLPRASVRSVHSLTKTTGFVALFGRFRSDPRLTAFVTSRRMEVPGEGSEPSISACPRFEARQSSGGTRRLPRRNRTESLNPMSAALCPAKPPGLVFE